MKVEIVQTFLSQELIMIEIRGVIELGYGEVLEKDKVYRVESPNRRRYTICTLGDDRSILFEHYKKKRKGDKPVSKWKVEFI